MKYAEDLRTKHDELKEKMYKTTVHTWAGNMPRPPGAKLFCTSHYDFAHRICVFPALTYCFVLFTT